MGTAGKAPAVLRALHRIKSYPPDLSHPIFAHYPAMKLGDRPAAEHFGALLAPLAGAIVANAKAPCVLTAPPMRLLPSGANLVCAALARRMKGLAHTTLRLKQPARPYDSTAEFDACGDYARLDYRSRREGQDEAVMLDIPVIAGHEVIVVNDINVTGTQMRRIASALERGHPARVHWLLIINVDRCVGRRFAHLESEINHSRIASQSEMIALLRSRDLSYTSKFVARLMSFGTASLAHIFAALDASKRQAIAAAIAAEGLYSGDAFREKVALAGG